MQETPLISVIMPVYNTALYVREAIESILNQTYKNFEFLIFDDGSTDDSLKIIQSYADERIRLFHSALNIGLVANLNKGLEIAKGTYIARMDSDDINFPERLEKQAAYLERHKDIQLVGAFMATFTTTTAETGLWSYPLDVDAIKARLLFNCSFGHATIMFRRELIDRGLYKYDDDYPVSEDYELWSRLALQRVRLANIGEPLNYYRLSQTQVSYVKKQIQIQDTNRIRRQYTSGYLANEKVNWNIFNDYWEIDKSLTFAQFTEFIHFYTVIVQNANKPMFLKEASRMIYYITLRHSTSFQNLLHFNESIFTDYKKIDDLLLHKYKLQLS